MEILAPISVVIVDRSGQLEAFLTNHVDLPTVDFSAVSDSRSLRKALEKTLPDALFFSPDFAEPSLLDFLKSFKKTAQGQATSVILFADRSQKELLSRCFEAGLDDYIAVPFVTAELLAKIKPLIRIKALRNDLAEIKQTMSKAGNAVVQENVTLKDQATKLREEMVQIKLALQEREQALAKSELGKFELQTQINSQAFAAKAVDEAQEKLGQLQQRIQEQEAEINGLKTDLHGLKTEKSVEQTDTQSRIQQLEKTLHEREQAYQKVIQEYASLQRDKITATETLQQKDTEREQALSELEIGLRLRRYVSQTLIERVIQSEPSVLFGTVPVKRMVAFMYVDVRDLAQFADDLEPPIIMALMNEVFTHISNIVNQYGGVVNKFLGDSLLAIFGDPIPQRDFILKALQAALKIKHIARNERERPGLLRSSYNVAIAVHAGTALFGNFGTAQQIDYTAIGREMMLAARLLGQSQDQEIIVTKNTYETLLPRVIVARERSVPVKGFDEDVVIAELESII